MKPLNFIQLYIIILMFVLFVNNVMINNYFNRGNSIFILVKIALTNSKNCAILRGMDTTLLRKAGLTESQAKGYLALIEHGALSPNELADHTGETRTNAYAVADKLIALGLATKKDGKPAKYTANHPSALELLAEKRRKAVTQNEQVVKGGLSPLIDLFYANTEMPGTIIYQGIDGIKSVYSDTLQTKTDIYLLRTTADTPDLGLEYLNSYRQKRAELGINTYALTPDTQIGRQYAATGEDEKMLFHRTFLPDNSYTAPVEIDIYGNKVALIAYGDTQMAIVITSPLVAEAMRQVLQLLSANLNGRSSDRTLPPSTTA